jgi:hypothetical protein
VDCSIKGDEFLDEMNYHQFPKEEDDWCKLGEYEGNQSDGWSRRTGQQRTRTLGWSQLSAAQTQSVRTARASNEALATESSLLNFISYLNSCPLLD